MTAPPKGSCSGPLPLTKRTDACWTSYGHESPRSGTRLGNFGGIFDLPQLTSDLEHLELEITHPDFWKDPQAAARLSRKKAAIEREIKRVADIERRYADLQAMIDLAEESEDAVLEQELAGELAQVESSVDQFPGRVAALGGARREQCDSGHPSWRWRHRITRLSPDALTHVRALGRAQGV